MDDKTLMLITPIPECWVNFINSIINNLVTLPGPMNQYVGGLKSFIEQLLINEYIDNEQRQMRQFFGQLGDIDSKVEFKSNADLVHFVLTWS
jgi:hypothetical protein